MKKFVITFAILLLIIQSHIFTINTKITTAEEPSFYMRVIDENTAIYKDQYCSDLLFYLPYTYYVKILSYNDFSVFVECFINNTTPSIDGYVKRDLLFNDYTSPSNPYVDLTLKTISTTVLYSDISLNNEICYIFENRNLTFYGRVKDQNDNYYYFVSYNNKLGYVKENTISPFSIENHPNPLTFLPPEQPEQPSETPNENDIQSNDYSFPLKIIIIVCLIFAVIIGFFVAFKKNNSNDFSTNNYYDENDYE